MPDAFDTACSILRRHAAALVATEDSADRLYLDTPHTGASGAPTFFGSVTRTRTGVSVHLMPVYTDPDLLDAVPQTLRARMTGKSCFAFRTLGDAQADALTALVDAAVARYRAHGYLDA